ncbi:MAG: alkane 1-monooxygenase [Pseudomonadota bacterium]
MTTTTLPAASQWKDSKRYLWPLGALIMLLPISGTVGYQLTGWAWMLWTGFIVLYGLIPLADKLMGEDSANPPDEVMPKLAADAYYRWALFLSVPMYLGMWFYMAWFATTVEMPWYGWLGMVMSLGVGCGLAINIGHELGHQTDPLERFLAKLVLAPGFYGHFYVEHNRGHHIRVATPEDPASSRFGETFYEFFPRCIIGSFKSAWQIEAKRLEREGKSVWHWSNDNLQSWAMTAAFWATVTVWLGWPALLVVAVAGAYGGSLLEVVNYLEHYGLMRQKRADGGYERCQPHHSWNSNHVVTNVMLYHLQRHSDHHANPTRSYQTLRHFEGTPALPSGYAAMILIAYIPPLWFKLMNPKVVAHHGGDMTRANIKPALRQQVIAQYTPSAA